MSAAPQLLLVREECSSLQPAQSVAASVASDGRHVLVAREDGSLVLAALPHGAPVASFRVCLQRDGSTEPLSRPISTLARTADGVLLSQRGSGKVLFCLDPLALGASTPVFLFGSQQGGITALAPSPSAGLLATGDSAGELCIRGLAYAAQLSSVEEAHRGGVSAACFLQNDLVVTGGSDGAVRVWRLSGHTLELEAELSVGEGCLPVCLAHCMDAMGEQLLAAGTSDGTVLVWAAQGSSWQARGALSGGRDAPVAALDCMPSSTQLAVAQGDSVSIYHLPSLAQLHRQQFPMAVAGCMFLDGGQLAVFPEAGSTLVQTIPAVPQPACIASPAAAGALRKSVRFLDSRSSLGTVGSRAGSACGSVVATEGASRALPPLPPHPLLQLRQSRGDGGSMQQPLSTARASGGLSPEALPLQTQHLSQQHSVRSAAGQPYPASAGGKQEASTSTNAASMCSRTLGAAALEASPPPSPSMAAAPEVPRARPPPAPSHQLSPAAARHCEACAVLGRGAASPRAPPDPRTLQQPEEAHGAESPTSPVARPWPPFPIKEGVSCSRADQEAGELLPLEQAPVVVIEHESALAHLEVRSERLVRVSRRVLPRPRSQLAEENRSTAGAGGCGVSMQRSSGTAAGLGLLQKAGTGDVGPGQPVAAAEAWRSGSCTAEGGLSAGADPAIASSPAADAVKLPSPWHADEVPSRRSSPDEATLHAPPAASVAAAGREGQSREAQALREVNQRLSTLDLRLGRLMYSAHQRGVDALEGAAAKTAGWEISNSGVKQELDSSGKPAPSPTEPLASSAPPQACLSLAAQEPLPLPTFAAPPQHALAVPQLNSSRILLAAQAAAAQRPAEVPEHVQREQRIKAATAATSFPPDAVVFPKPQPVPDAPQESPKKVPKQLDPRWVAERPLRPRLEDLWRPPQQLARTPPVPFSIELCPQRVAARLLGLK